MVVLVVIASPFKVAAATSAATCFGKRGGIIDHSEEEHRRAVHDLRTPFRYRLHKRTVEQLPLWSIHLCRCGTELTDQTFQQDILEKAVHFGVYVV